MPDIRELTFNQFSANYNSTSSLQEAFASISNATLIKNNDTQVVILDEENQIFYEADYSIDYDLKEVTFKNFAPITLKEERVNTKKLFTEAMDRDVSDDSAIDKIKKIAVYMTKRALGGDRSLLIKEARSKSFRKKVDRGRREVLEDLHAFKSENYHVISDIKSKGFYNRFVEKYNDKYMNEDVSINVLDRLNFSFINRRNRLNDSGPVFKKKISLKEGLLHQNNKYFNPLEILKNSPSFVSKLNRFINSTYRDNKEGNKENIEEAKKIFVNFANNWPVIYLVSEEKHGEFAIKHFSNHISDKQKAKACIDIYSTITSSDEFKTAQEKYLKEEHNWKIDEVSKLRESVDCSYDTKTIDEVSLAISELRESVKSIPSKNVSNYLAFAEKTINAMLRKGEYDEELIERLAVDIFGDHKIIMSEHLGNEIAGDADFQGVDEEEDAEKEGQNRMVEARASSLVVRLRGLIPSVGPAMKSTLEEDLELVKSMIAINSIDEAKLERIENMIGDLKRGDRKEKKEVSESIKKEAHCPGCFENLDAVIAEAVESGSRSVECPSCKNKLEV